jgi:hypothetical protein
MYARMSDSRSVLKSHELCSCASLVDKEGRIYVPKQLQKHTTTWYHEMLMHPSETWMELTIAHHYTWKGMRKTVKHVCSRCDSCQHNKCRHSKLRKLNPKDPKVVPWQMVCINLIGPYPIGEINKDKKGKVISDTLTTCWLDTELANRQRKKRWLLRGCYYYFQFKASSK